MDSKLLGTLIASGALLVTGCTSRFVDYTIISTKNIDLSKAATFQRGANRTEGIDTAHIIIFIPTGNPNLKEAIDRAIEAVPGAVALLDGVVTSSFYFIPLIYGEANFAVEGTPLIDPALAPKRAEATSPYMIAALDKSGQVATFKYVSRSEYDVVKQQIAAGSKNRTGKP